MSSNCEICAILRSDQEDSTVFETKCWRVVLSPDQAYLGRGWVTLKTHVGSIAELTSEQWIELHEVITRYQRACGEAFGAQPFNWACLMNNAFKEETPAPHVHWHVWPRYKLPPKVGDREFADPNFAHMYDRDAHRMVEPEVLREIVQAIRAKYYDGRNN